MDTNIAAELRLPLERSPAYYRLKADIEDVLYAEADMLDERRYKDWLEMLTEDVTYFMPMRRNVKFGQHAERENTKQGQGISWFDEDKWTLTKRVEQILTGVHYAEEPLSRVWVLSQISQAAEIGLRRWVYFMPLGNRMSAPDASCRSSATGPSGSCASVQCL